MLKLTGHPLYDAGAATIAAFSGKNSLDDVTLKDLDAIAEYMKEQYVVDPLKSFLTVAFPNSGFTNPAFNKKPEERAEYANLIFSCYREDVPLLQEKCIFTGKPAVAVAFSDKLPKGKAFRQHIPLITGEGVINFFPDGQAGLYVSGLAILCIHAFPLGAAKCAGKLLAVHSDNDELLINICDMFLKQNMSNIAQASAAKSKKLAESVFLHKTLLIDTFQKVVQNIKIYQDDYAAFSVSAYHISNSGQGPSVDIYHLPLEILGFLKKAMSSAYRSDWEKIVKKSWQINTDSPRRNYLYEDIFRLPENAAGFVRVYFMRSSIKGNTKDDPRKHYTVVGEADMVSWKLTELFLTEVMNMRKERIEQIKDLGDKLSEYIIENNERNFFRRYFIEQKYDFFRALLLKANLNQVKKGKEPLITFNPYLEIFEEGEDLAYKDWRLARDLSFIRLVEQLHHKGWLGSNNDALEEVEEDIDKQIEN